MCDKAVNGFLPTLYFVPDWFATSKIIEKLHNALFTDDHIVFTDEGSGIVTFSSGDLNNINLDDVNSYKEDLETIIYVRLMAWHSKELMPVTGHPTR